MHSFRIAMAENTDWTENTLNWKTKPAILEENGVITSEEFNLGKIVSNDPAQISTPNGTIATADVTSLVAAAKAAGRQYHAGCKYGWQTGRQANRISL